MTFYIGLDLGQAQDYTALAVLERIQLMQKVHGGWDARPVEGAPGYHTRHLQRFRLGMSYPAIVERVTALAATPALGGYSPIVDATGVGRPVVDLLRGAGLAPVAVTITGGSAVAGDRHAGYNVPKRDLVSTLQVLLQGQRLKFAEGLPEVPMLVKELLAFQVKITANANDTYGAWREGAHDDLVLAVALAVWYGERDSGTGAISASYF